MPKYKQTEEILKIMRNKECVRNVGTLAHVDHGKTTLSDNLLAGAGLISPKIAAQALALDYVEIEQMRQMTVKAANVSLLHERNGKSYVINLVDTPGHVDFTGHVTRSLRVMDGAIVVVDSVEGVMTQTETVVRQAMEERVRPLLYINKIDRLIKELRLSPQEVMDRLVKIIRDFNNLIEIYGEPGFKDAWKVNPNRGQVAFGSALHKWGFTLPIITSKGWKFSDIVNIYQRGDIETLQKELPLHVAILDMVVDHIPNPVEAQKYRIPKIWRGDTSSEIGKAMLECDENGPLVICVNKVVVDPHAGPVVTGRVFSGVVKEGDPVYLLMARSEGRIQQVALYMGPYREVAPEISAGNIVALLGLEKALAGETIVHPSYKDVMVPFEKMKYISEPVVTIAIEPKHSKDLPKLIDALHKMAIEDPTLSIKINQETGEYLISGMGSLHLEVALWDLQQRTGGIEIVTSPPIVVYRESIKGSAGPFEGKSPNKHNKFYIMIEPLNEETINLIQQGIINEDQDSKERAKILRERAKWDTEEARGIWAIEEHVNVFVDVTKGLQYLREVKDTAIQAFRLAMAEGPLAREPIRGVKVKLVDAVIHEDPAHRGPAQVIPAIRDATFAAFLSAKPVLLEPMLKLDVKVPQEYLGGVTRIISSKRGKIITIEQSGQVMHVVAEIPVAETFDLSDQLRSATAGRAFWGTEFSRWAPVPDSMAKDVIRKIRERKGLPPEPPKPEDFMPM
ncbi:MAG: elongation factor EF-2 [Candidatus Methanomethylicota archaeon]|uniref:Elongation factor 2 n=1 Tax=Thermoproteota archaeon TaxID=2056631 RepID=A0A497EZJ8_9CREN|nr:MAG: elongation factor EF-2 [Candidatus Verstraetearchaeota archaeon]RLE52645.1 MAG: elongation factor EF-2 [Candidatus Verstraetearchaeota archaeon]